MIQDPEVLLQLAALYGMRAVLHGGEDKDIDTLIGLATGDARCPTLDLKFCSVTPNPRALFHSQESRHIVGPVGPCMDC